MDKLWIQHNTFEVIEERRLRWLGHLRMGSDRIPKMILKWNVEGRRKTEKPREQWMDGVRVTLINKDLAEELWRSKIFLLDGGYLLNCTKYLHKNIGFYFIKHFLRFIIKSIITFVYSQIYKQYQYRKSLTNFEKV